MSGRSVDTSKEVVLIICCRKNNFQQNIQFIDSKCLATEKMLNILPSEENK